MIQLCYEDSVKTLPMVSKYCKESTLCTFIHSAVLNALGEKGASCFCLLSQAFKRSPSSMFSATDDPFIVLGFGLQHTDS